MNRKRPFGITFISACQWIRATVLLLVINTPQSPAMNVRFGVPFLPELLVKIVVIGFGMVSAYGYFKQTKWGFYTILISSFLYAMTCWIQGMQMGWYALVVGLYTLSHVNDFKKTPLS